MLTAFVTVDNMGQQVQGCGNNDSPLTFTVSLMMANLFQSQANSGTFVVAIPRQRTAATTAQKELLLAVPQAKLAAV